MGILGGYGSGLGMRRGLVAGIIRWMRVGMLAGAFGVTATPLPGGVLSGGDNDQGQVGTFGRPAGWLRFNLPAASQTVVSFPFDPASNILDDALTGQLAGAATEAAADTIDKWNVVTQAWLTAFKAAGTGDPAKDGKWFMSGGWTPSRLTVVPGDAFRVTNRRAAAQTLYLAGHVPLGPSRAVVLQGGQNLMAAPFVASIPFNASGLAAQGAFGSTSTSGNPDRISNAATAATVWLKRQAGAADNNLWLNLASGLPSADAFTPGQGYWYWHNANAMCWYAPCPYDTSAFIPRRLPEIADLTVNPQTATATLIIACTGQVGETLQIFARDTTPGATSDLALGWQLMARDIATNGAAAVTWTDATVAGATLRLYLVARQDEDADADGMPDGWETLNGFDPLVNDAGADADNDGLTNLQEYQAGADPYNDDTDNDGLPDGWEVEHGLSPTSATDALADIDGDGLYNLQEYLLGTDPNDTDTDGDGLPDGWEVATGLDPLAAAVLNTATVKVWGDNSYGTLGLGDSALPTKKVPGLANVAMVAAGSSHTLAVKMDGTVWAWGYNGSGQLGLGDTTQRTAPVQVPGLSGVVAIAAGGSHTLAVKRDGTVWAWGYNGSGQLGLGNTTQRTSPVQVPGLSGVIALAAGSSHTLAVKTDGTVWAWGYNGYGQLGLGNTTQRMSPVQVPGLSGVVAIAAGSSHTLAVKTNGTVWAWGYNYNGQLGLGNTTQRTAPVQVSGLSGVVAIATGGCHTLAVKSDGTIWAWGANGSGQLGLGDTTQRTAPVQIPGLSGVVTLAAGYSHSLAVKTDGTVWAWGYNGNGQLGLGDTMQRTAPVQLPGLSGVVALAAGYTNTLAVKMDGTVQAWGYNGNGQLGLGDTTSPVQVPSLSGVVALAVGGFPINGSHTLALKTDGTVWAWGYNGSGQLGVGDTTQRTSLVQVLGLSGAVALAAGYMHTLAVKSDGTAWAWGANYTGQLGLGDTTQRTAPVQLPGLSGVVALAAGSSHTLAVKTDGTVWAWGYNGSGQLGVGDTTQRNAPVLVPGLSGVVAIAAGGSHSLALKANGTVWAWGYNYTGQLGLGDTTQRTAPVQIPGLSGVVALAAGGAHSLAMKTDGTVWAWGYNYYGQLGVVDTTQRTSPVLVTGLSGVVAMAAGYSQSAAITSSTPATIGMFGRPAGFAKRQLPASSQSILSTPFEPFSGNLNGLFWQQLTGAANETAADTVSKWNVATQTYVTAFKAANTGDPAKNGKWFLSGGWTPATLTVSPGEAVRVENRQAAAEMLFLTGRVVLYPKCAVTLQAGRNLFAYPFTGGLALNEACFPSYFAKGAANQAGAPDLLSTATSPTATYWLKKLAGAADDGKWLTTTTNTVTAAALQAGHGYQYTRSATSAMSWVAACPYDTSKCVAGRLPEIAAISVTGSGTAMTLSIAGTGATGETLQIFAQDVAARDVPDLTGGWSLVARNITTNGATSVTWTDTAADEVADGDLRLYLVARQDEDADGDGISDGWETLNGLDPLTNDAALDPDGDGLTNLQEFQADTDPHHADTDGDGVNDAIELQQGRDPTANGSVPDTANAVALRVFTVLE